MNKDMSQRLLRLISTFRMNVFGDSFEKAVLHDLSSLFLSSGVAIAHKAKDSIGEQIEVCELREEEYKSSALSAATFAATFGIAFDDRPAVPTGSDVNPQEERAWTVVSCKLRRSDYVILIKTNEKSCFHGNSLAQFNSIMGLLLQARCSVRNAMKISDLSHKSQALVRHKIEGAISSIFTAIEMFLSLDLSDKDREELWKLARRGETELTETIDNIA